jgi:hypothetical protein
VKEYKFPDPDYEGYEITIPREVVKDITLSYMKTTFYWSVGIAGFLIGLLLGIII